jgi:uncharacterized protein (TIGR00369 family)
VRIPPPIAELLGLELVSGADGEAVMEMDAREEHTNPMGTIQGGVLCALADGAMGWAYVSQLGEGESFTTLELKINYLRPFWTGKLVATGRVVHCGRTVGLVECEIVDDQGRLIAHATSTCLTLRGEAAAGR